MGELRNWSGYQRFTPAEHAHPATVDEVSRVVSAAAAAGRKVRARGNGHSFSEIVETPDTLISLDALSGVIDADRESGLVKVGAGTSIHQLSQDLDALGLALPNLGDIDVQAVAGAAATGTHGTGERFASVSAQVEAMDLVVADGSVVTIDGSDPQALQAARVSLGALGIATAITLQCVPAFTLDRRDVPRPLDETYEQLDELSAAHDHFEYYIFPYTDRVIQKRIDRTEDAPRTMSKAKLFLNDIVFENWFLAFYSNVGRMCKPMIPSLARAVTKTFSNVHKVDRSPAIFSTVRNVRFNEMEYAVPRESLNEAVQRVMAAVAERKLPVNFPIEVRVGRADPDCMISTAAGRATGYISVHTYRGMEFEPYFRAVEEVMNDLDGRPHWGKMNWQTAESLAPRYPRWDEWQAVRRRLDPDGVFTNAYLERLIGPVA